MKKKTNQTLKYSLLAVAGLAVAGLAGWLLWGKSSGSKDAIPPDYFPQDEEPEPEVVTCPQGWLPRYNSATGKTICMKISAGTTSKNDASAIKSDLNGISI